MTIKKKRLNSLTELISPADLDLLSASGSQLVEQIGLDVVRGVVLDILTGKNLRDSTETLTRRRIATLNLATVELFVKGSANSKDFINHLPNIATEILSKKGLSKTVESGSRDKTGCRGLAVLEGERLSILNIRLRKHDNSESTLGVFCF